MLKSMSPISRTLTALDLISEKQRLLSTNLANMDTPNYIRKDISFEQYMGGAVSPLETKLSAKMGPSPVMMSSSFDSVVDPATELSEMQKNYILYTMATRRMTSIISEMRSAVNMGNG